LSRILKYIVFTIFTCIVAKIGDVQARISHIELTKCINEVHETAFNQFQSHSENAVLLHHHTTSAQFLIENLDEKEVLSDITPILVQSHLNNCILNLSDKQINQNKIPIGIVSPPPKH
jgi:hypothetical protein